jgi:hypothetical protein
VAPATNSKDLRRESSMGLPPMFSAPAEGVGATIDFWIGRPPKAQSLPLEIAGLRHVPMAALA